MRRLSCNLNSFVPFMIMPCYDGVTVSVIDYIVCIGGFFYRRCCVRAATRPPGVQSIPLPSARSTGSSISKRAEPGGYQGPEF